MNLLTFWISELKDGKKQKEENDLLGEITKVLWRISTLDCKSNKKARIPGW